MRANREKRQTAEAECNDSCSMNCFRINLINSRKKLISQREDTKDVNHFEGRS